MVKLVVSAGVIFGAGTVLKGVTVKGFGGALLAAAAIAAINYGLVLVLGGVVNATP